MMPALPDFDALWDYDHPAASESRFRALLPQAEAAGDAAYRAELLTQIARTEGLQGRFAAAHQTLDTVEALLTPDLVTARIRYLLERGRVFNSAGAPEPARPLFQAAWDLARAHGADYHAIDAAHMLGIVAPPAAQLAWHEQALALTEATPDPRAQTWRGPLYNNIGWTYHDQGHYAQALAIFEKGLAWRAAQGEAKATYIARWSVGCALRALGRLDDALALQQGLAHDPAAPADWQGYVAEELGECLLAQGRPAAARPYFAQAYAALSQDSWLTAHEAPRLQRLRELATTSGEEDRTIQKL